MKIDRLNGCYTALITPMKDRFDIDFEGLKKLVNFQIEEGVSGILAVGTTGESATLTHEESIEVIKKVFEDAGHKCIVIAGTGSNSTDKTIRMTREVYDLGIKCVLLVDPYYNGPSSLEIRREYIEPIAEMFPEMQIIPYVIPGRTGTQLLPQDLAILHRKFRNVRAVKEATGNIENMRLTRKLCGNDFYILSGDDDKTYEIMVDPDIRANGVVSVSSNIVPNAIERLTRAILEKRIDEARSLNEALKPLFSIVTVKTEEETPYGIVSCRARNPLPYKTIMNILGMPSGPCRRPLGKMTKKGLEVALRAVRTVYEKNPELLKPIEDFFDVDLSKRLYNENFWKGLAYDQY
ncbi:MAG: 4-hydroxy-tetrahydrodipicolinate synthase [Candidatus Bathyarchaeia archaeon]|nr:4-hydroxy-tetrahydrodipicolinate synthase [Candidatus Bathyarchaeota archaeon]